MTAEIYPLEKIVINGDEIYLDMERAAVEALIGIGQAVGARNYYFNGEMAIDYNSNKVEFIEFLAGAFISKYKHGVTEGLRILGCAG